MKKYWKKLLLWLVARVGRDQEKLEHNGFFTIDGQPVHCQLCHHAIQYPPIKIPLGPPHLPMVDPVMSPDGYCLNPETIYGRFHIACASRYLLVLRARELEFQPQETVSDEQSDPG